MTTVVDSEEDEEQEKLKLEKELFQDEQEQKQVDSSDLVAEETIEIGTASLKDVNRYLNFSLGPCCSFFLYLTFGAIASGLGLATTYFISYWANQTHVEQQRDYYPRMFTYIMLSFMLFSLIRSINVYIIGLTASRNMHN